MVNITSIDQDFSQFTEEERDTYRQDVFLTALAHRLRIPHKQMFEESTRAEVVEILSDTSIDDNEKVELILAYFGTKTGLSGTELRHAGKQARAFSRKGERRKERKSQVVTLAKKRKDRGTSIQPGAHIAAREDFHRKFEYCPKCQEYMPVGHIH